MYTISSDVLNLFQEYANQIIRITVSPTSGASFTLTNSDIMAESLTVDRYSTTGDKIEIGSAIAGQLKFRIANPTGAFNSKVFEGAQMYVEIGVTYNGSVVYVPFGYFTVDNQPRRLSIISIIALDRMVKFDKYVDFNSVTFPRTLANIISACCTKCGVTCATDLTTLPNYSYSVPAAPQGTDITYRQLIQWAAALTGTCAYIDRSGQLRFGFYGNAALDSFRVTTSNSYSQTQEEADITVSGIAIQNAGTGYLAGTDDYAINIVGNLLAQSNFLTLATNIYNAIGGYTYRPYKATTRPIPHLDPLDPVVFIGEDGAAHNSMITKITFKADASTETEASGRTAERNGYAALGAMTARQTEILAALKKAVDDEIDDITDREEALLNLNELITNSLGLYVTKVAQPGGGDKYYYHDGSTLASSSIIYTFNAGGFAWTDDWNGGNPTWNYGITRDGNAVINMLSAYKITTDLLSAGCVTANEIAQSYKTSVTNEINASATSVTQAFQAADGQLRSDITTVTDSLDGRLDTAETNITQNTQQIALKASQTEVNTLTGRVATTESQISLEADKIALLVDSSNNINAAAIVASINDAGSSVLISADHVNLSGYVTISSLGSGGSTQIDGSRITTGTIAAARIDTDNLVVKNILVKSGSNILMQTGSNSLKIGGFDVSSTQLLGVNTVDPGPNMEENVVQLSSEGTVKTQFTKYSAGVVYSSKSVTLADGGLSIDVNDMAIPSTAMPIISATLENNNGTFYATVYVDLVNDRIYVIHL